MGVVGFIAAAVVGSSLVGGGGGGSEEAAPAPKPQDWSTWSAENTEGSFNDRYNDYKSYVEGFDDVKFSDYEPPSVVSDYLGGTRFENSRVQQVAEGEAYNNKIDNIQDFDSWLSGQDSGVKEGPYGSQRQGYLDYVQGEFGDAPTFSDSWAAVADGLKRPTLKTYDPGAYDPGNFMYTDERLQDYIGGKVFRTQDDLNNAINAADFEYGKDKFGGLLDTYGVDYTGMTSAQMQNAFNVASTIGAQADMKQQKIEEIQNALDAASGSYDAIKEEYDAKLGEFADLQAQFDDLYGSYNALTGSYGAQQEEFDALSNQYMTAQEELVGLQDQLTEQGSVYDTLSGEFDTLTGEYKTLQDEYAGLGDEYSGLMDQFSSLGDEYSGLQTQFGGLQDDYSALNTQYTDTLGALDAQKALYDQAQADIREDYIMDISNQTLANTAAQEAADQAKQSLGQMPTVPEVSPLDPASYTQMPVDYLSGFSPSLFQAPDLTVDMPDFSSAYTPVQLPQTMGMTQQLADYSQPFTGYLDAINNQYGVSPQSAYSGIMGARK